MTDPGEKEAEEHFARVEKRETPEHWAVVIPGCGLGLDFKEEKVARNLSDQINTANRSRENKAVRDALEEAARTAEQIYISPMTGNCRKDIAAGIRSLKARYK